MDNPHYMTLAGIATKYHPSTGRISARRLDHKSGDPIAYLSTGNYSNHVDAHAEAAKQLIVKMGVDWTISPVGCFDNDRYIWTMQICDRPTIQSITVIGKLWRDKINGNTYHSSDAIVDGRAYKSAYQYGYGDHYMQSALALLNKHGVIVTPEYMPLWQYCSEHGIKLNRYAFYCNKSELNKHESVDP
jgi:hypothetical protein